jgi:hypothetical protein
MTSSSDNTVLTHEKIVENFERYEKLCMKLGDRVPVIEVMLTEIGERLALAPASTRRDFHAAYPGGLVEHTLRVAQYALMLKRAVKLFADVSDESVVFAALFHDLGKVGQPGRDGADFYVVEENSWQREKLGKFYNINPNVQKMSNVDCTFMLLMHYGIRPTRDEMLAIRLNDGQYAESNREYSMHEPKLALLIHTADRFAVEEEKEMMK